MTPGFILFNHVRVEGVNAEANQYVAGFPGVSAFTGYGHLLERKINEKFPENRVLVNGVSIISHEFQMDEGHPKISASTDGAKTHQIVTPPILEEIKADMTISLVFSIMIKENPEEELPEIGDFAHVFLDSFPMCGGSCWNKNPVETFLDKIELWERLEGFSDGHVLIERMDLLGATENNGQPVGCDDHDSLSDLLNVLTVHKHESDGKITWRRNQPGWIVPIAVGYQAIETPQKRLSVRDAQPHVYAEPLIGLGEFVSIKKITFGFLTGQEEKVFWAHKNDKDRGLYYTSCE